MITPVPSIQRASRTKNASLTLRVGRVGLPLPRASPRCPQRSICSKAVRTSSSVMISMAARSDFSRKSGVGPRTSTLPTSILPMRNSSTLRSGQTRAWFGLKLRAIHCLRSSISKKSRRRRANTRLFPFPIAPLPLPGFSGIVTITLKTDLAGTKHFLENTNLFALAESLGGVESLINHPALMTHASVPKERREALGISNSLVRLSVGVEDVRDLIDDLKTALEAT